MRRTILCIVFYLASSPLMCPALAEEITLVTGETLRGEILEQTGEYVRLKHPILGELTVPRAQVTAVHGGAQVESDSGAPATVVAAEQAPPQEPAAPGPEPAAIAGMPPTPGLMDSSFLKGWKRQLEVALNGTDGNNETLDLRAGFLTSYEDKSDRCKFSAIYSRAENDGQTTRNNFTSEIVRDWLLPDDPRFFFASGTYEFNELRSWEHRMTAFGGVGYAFVKAEKWDLRGRAGGGGNYEFNDGNGFTPEGLLGLETEYRIAEGHKVLAYSTFFPTLESPLEFRNVSGAAWQAVIDRDLGLSIKVGAENEYESDVAVSDKTNELKYFAGLTWGF